MADAAVTIPKALADVSNLQPFLDNAGACPATYPRDKNTRFREGLGRARRGTAARVA
jgi:hypothetical protein